MIYDKNSPVYFVSLFRSLLETGEETASRVGTYMNEHGLGYQFGNNPGLSDQI